MSVLLEWEAELLQQRATLLVVGRRGDDRDVHAAGTIDPVLVNLVEHDLLGEAEGVVATAVELAGVEAPEVTDAWQRQRQQPVEELPHPVAPERHVRPDRHTLTQLELGDGLAGLGHHRFLTGDHGQVADRALDQLGVARGLADAHVDHDLGQAGHLHDVRDVELAAERGEDLLAVAGLEARGHLGLGGRGLGLRRLGGLGGLGGLGSRVSHQISLPVLRETRTLRCAVYVEPSARRLVTSSRRNPMRVTPLPSTSITLDTWIGASVVMMPPVVPARPPDWTTLVCRLTRLTPSTITRWSSRNTAMTLPSAPLSEPAITLTVSPFLMFKLGFFLLWSLFWAMSQHLRCQRDDLHELLVAQLAAHGAEDAGAARLAVLAEDHRGVLVEADVGPVAPAPRLHGAHDDRLDDVTLLDVAAGDRVLDGAHDDVADAGVATSRATEHPDAQDFLGTGVVGDLESRLLLDHLARSRICTTRQRFVADRGRVSMIRTRSPTPQSLASSWALSRDVRRMTLP